jgi:hypothetical protein
MIWIWICIACKKIKLYYANQMHLYQIGIEQFFSHSSLNTTKNSNNFQSVFGVRKEDMYCAVLKKA